MMQLQKRRERDGMLVQDLSIKAGVSIDTIRDIESGTYARRVQPRVQRGLARALKCRPADLFDGDGRAR